jgi:hypothetical protein
MEGLVVSTVSLLLLFVGFVLLFNLPKLRTRGPRSRAIRSLDDLVGRTRPYLGPDAPRGTVDQLRTPELLETTRRNSA